MAVAALDMGCSGDAGNGPNEEAIGQVQAALDTKVDITPAGSGQQFHKMSWFPCAGEGALCYLNNYPARYVAFGPAAGGPITFLNSFQFKSISGTFRCNAAQFGAPATSKVARSCFFSQFTPAFTQSGQPTKEGQFTNKDTVGTVAFGANGAFNFITYPTPRPVDCSVAEFQDPRSGAPNACYVIADYTYVGDEHSLLQAYALPMAYCGGGLCNYKIVSGINLPCDNTTFGDPNVGITKSCYAFRLPNLVASENQNYMIQQSTGSVDVGYGSGLNGLWFDGNNINGACTNAAFGGDPDFGVSKFCYTGNNL
jgi:hypothetical protein